MKDSIYLACYSKGSYEDYEEIIVFASPDKEKVEKWIDRFQSIHEKEIEYYNQFCVGSGYYGRYLKEEYRDLYSQRWYRAEDINDAYCREIELR